MTSYNIFGKQGEFIGMPDNERDALSADERAAYDAVLDAASKCEVAEQLVIALERQLVTETAGIRAIAAKLAALPRVTRLDCVREMIRSQ
jgi:hypothetical protein